MLSFETKNSQLRFCKARQYASAYFVLNFSSYVPWAMAENRFHTLYKE